MERSRYAHKVRVLWLMILLALAYGSFLYFLHTLTGTRVTDGVIGVLLGLYICSHPAANLVDILFFSRGAQGQFSPRRSFFLWLALNMLVFVVGWVVIFLGTTHLVGKGD